MSNCFVTLWGIHFWIRDSQRWKSIVLCRQSSNAHENVKKNPMQIRVRHTSRPKYRSCCDGTKECHGRSCNTLWMDWQGLCTNLIVSAEFSMSQEGEINTKVFFPSQREASLNPALLLCLRKEGISSHPPTPVGRTTEFPLALICQKIAKVHLAFSTPRYKFKAGITKTSSLFNIVRFVLLQYLLGSSFEQARSVGSEF